MELVFDRTQQDVLLGNDKGYYSEKDLNRVENAVQQLQQLAQQLDIHMALQTKTDWAFTDAYSPETWPTAAQMQRYLSNVILLCKNCGIVCKLPESMEHLNWKRANQIEAALYQTYQHIESILGTYRFSGEVFSGEENIV